MKKKRPLLLSNIALCILLCLHAFATGCTTKPAHEYGVFLGIDSEQIDLLYDYRIVVIEPSEFQASQIGELQAAGTTVYGYLNMGAIEEYRPYYDRFKDMLLDVYIDWPDERWVDVSSREWQSFVVDELGKQYSDMGLDGFFLDNADVYYHYPTDRTFHGLCTILKGLGSYDIPLIINGGDIFVSRCIDENIALSLFDGINQETVFTNIDFENKSYGIQQESETQYFQDYLEKVKNCGMPVYLLEYNADRALSKEIDSYCTENGFLWYNAKGLELK